MQHLPYSTLYSYKTSCIFLQSMLRGRGGCYKHTFYGIESHRCMESTPSLACANKCVFCWRFVGSTFLNILEKVWINIVLPLDIIQILLVLSGDGKWTNQILLWMKQSIIIAVWLNSSKVCQVCCLKRSVLGVFLHLSTANVVVILYVFCRCSWR